MTDVLAVICELNPATLGHQCLVETIKSQQNCGLVAILSGNFVQRGEPSIVDKKTRARLALEIGFDLVIELPSIWSMSTAEKFANSSVLLAEKLGCVDALVFGSECGSTDILDKISETVLDSELELKKNLEKGYSLAKSRENVVRELLGESFSGEIRNPNNILAIEYINSIKRLRSSIGFKTVKREISKHDSSDIRARFASSSQVRRCMKSKDEIWKKFVPKSCIQIIETEFNNCFAPVDLNSAETALLYRLRTMTLEDFSLLPDISEGLENRIFEAAKSATSFNDLMMKIQTKRYTNARLRRIVMYAFLNITKAYQDLEIPYINVLASNETGLEILKKAKISCHVPVISRHLDRKKLTDIGKLVFDKELELDSIYNLMSPKILPSGFLNSKKFVIIKR